MTAPKLSFNTPNGRYYQNPATRAQKPSITNITGKKDKSGLKFWAAKEAAAFAVDQRDAWVNLPPDDAKRLIKGAPFAKKDDGPSVIGDIVHDWIDRYVKGDAPTEDEISQAVITARRMWSRFLAFVEYYQPSFVDSEFSVWSDTYGYAGSADLHLNLAGSDILVDTKTGNQVYPEVGMQLAALALADFIIEPDGSTRPLPQFSKFGVLHLRPMSFSLVPVFNIEESFKAFLALKQVFDWEVEFSSQTLGYAPKVGTRS